MKPNLLCVSLAFLMLVAFTLPGCLNGPSSVTVNESPAPALKNTSPATCFEQCSSQAHQSCIGSWKVTGTYPSCSCAYECEAVPGNNASGNVTAPPNPPPSVINPEPVPPLTNKTPREMLASGLAALRSDFYRNNDGQFKDKVYSWNREALDENGKSIGWAPVGDVKFGGLEIGTILSSGFVYFESVPDGARSVLGMAIFKSRTTVMDSYGVSDLFDVDYFPALVDKAPKSCSIYAKEYFRDAQGGDLSVYYFKCPGAKDK